MNLDLFSILLGRPGADAISAEWGGSLATVRCQCGRTLAAAMPSPEGRVIQCAGWRLTRAHTLMIVVDAAMNDVDLLLARVDQGDTASEAALRVALGFLEGDTDLLARQLPAMEIPGLRNVRMADVSRAVHEAERESADRGVAPGQVSNLVASCRGCRSTYYLGRHLVALAEDPKLKTVIARDTNRFSQITTGTWPESGIGMRTRLYAHLSGVLASAL